MTDVKSILRDIAIIKSFLNNPSQCIELVQPSGLTYLGEWYAIMIDMHKKHETIDNASFAYRAHMTDASEEEKEMLHAIFGYDSFSLFAMYKCSKEGKLK
jgi:hypothetical protein